MHAPLGKRVACDLSAMANERGVVKDEADRDAAGDKDVTDSSVRP